MPYLEVRLGPDSLLMRFVGRIDYVFGRLPKADVQLRDMSVSRLHTQIFMDSRGNAFVRDLGSSGGTFMNDQQLKGTKRLKDGARVRIGQARFVFYHADPPVNSKDAPAKSDPKGLIRFNVRERYMAGNETVLAAERVAPKDENEPAEEPPEVKQEEFSDDAKPMQPSTAKPAVKSPSKSTTLQSAPATPVKKRATGIVPAPWEESWPPQSTDKRKVTSIPLKPSQTGPPSALTPARGLNPAKPAPLNAPRKPEAPLPPGALTEAPARLPSPKMPVAPAKPLVSPAAPAEPKSEPGRRRTLSEEMMDEASAPAAMPTVKLGSVPSTKPASGETKAHPASGEIKARPASGEVKAVAAKPPSGETKSAPRPASVEIKAAKAPPPVPPTEEKNDAEPDLTTDEIAEYFGGQRKTGKLQEVNFGGKGSEDEPEDRKFGPGAKLGDDGDDDISEESELDLGGTPAKPAQAPSKPATKPVAKEAGTAPPAQASGKAPTRPLMKRKELPGHDDLTVIAPKGGVPEDEAKTVYVPKPEGFPADSKRPREKAEPQGPGGDTFHVPKEMAAELAKAEEARLRAKKAAAAQDSTDFSADDAAPDAKKSKADASHPGDTVTG